MLFKKIFFSLLTLFLILAGVAFGSLFILFLAIVLWSVSGYAVGAMFGVLCILFFATAWAALRLASKRGKRRLNVSDDSAQLQGAKRMFSSRVSRIKRELLKK